MRNTWQGNQPRLKKLEERKDIGRAVSLVEQERLFKALESDRTPHLRVLIPLLLLTGLRAGEAFSLTWGQVDLMAGTITVGRAKTSSGTGRVIPIGRAELARAIAAAHRAAFTERFAPWRPAHYLFAWGASVAVRSATRYITGVKHAWEKARGSRLCIARPHARPSAHVRDGSGRGRRFGINDARNHGTHESHDVRALLSHSNGGKSGSGGSGITFARKVNSEAVLVISPVEHQIDLIQ